MNVQPIALFLILSSNPEISPAGLRVIDSDGVRIVKIEADSPFAEALQEGDLILSIDGMPVPSAKVLRAILRRSEPGEPLAIQIKRHGESRRASVVLEADAGRRPELAPRVLSARTPGANEGALALGLAVYAPIPTFALRWVHGLTDRMALDLALDSIGVAQAARGGLRLALSESARSAVSLRLSAVEAHAVLSFPLFLAGAGPGLVVSYASSPTLEWTASLDAAVVVSSNALDSGVALQLRPAVGLELPIAPEMGLVLEANAQILQSPEQSLVLPGFLAGLSW